MSLTAKGRTPTIERIASCLHGIEIVPAKEQSRMVNKACLEANLLVEEARRIAMQYAAQLLREDVDTHCPGDSWYRKHFMQVADSISQSSPNKDEGLYRTLKQIEWCHPTTCGGACPLCHMLSSKGHERGCMLAAQLEGFDQSKTNPVCYYEEG